MINARRAKTIIGNKQYPSKQQQLYRPRDCDSGLSAPAILLTTSQTTMLLTTLQPKITPKCSLPVCGHIASTVCKGSTCKGHQRYAAGLLPAQATSSVSTNSVASYTWTRVRNVLGTNRGPTDRKQHTKPQMFKAFDKRPLTTSWHDDLMMEGRRYCNAACSNPNHTICQMSAVHFVHEKLSLSISYNNTKLELLRSILAKGIHA